MAWNGSGTFSRTNGTNSGSTTWQQDRDAGTKILASRHDTHDQDLAAGIQACLAKNGENAATANLPMGGFIHTGVGTASARTHYGTVSQIQDSTYHLGGTVAGTANAQTMSLTPTITGYTPGLKIRYVAALNNTGAMTVNINGVGAANVKKVNGQSAKVALQQGDVLSANVVELVYDGTDFVLLNPTSRPSYNAAVAAAGTNQGTATAIDATVVNVSAADGTKGVILPAYAQGTMVFVTNTAIAALNVYPPSGWSFAAKGANTAVSLPANASGIFAVVAATEYGAVIGATF